MLRPTLTMWVMWCERKSWDSVTLGWRIRKCSGRLLRHPCIGGRPHLAHQHWYRGGRFWNSAAPVNAAGIATINALAPGARSLVWGRAIPPWVMGSPPQRIAEFETYLQTLALLLKGEEALYTHKGQTQPIRHIMPDKGFVNFADPIPLYVSGFGPKSLALAGRYGQGAVLGAANPSAMLGSWHALNAGARLADRQTLRTPDQPQGESFYTTALTTMVILQPGEAVDSPVVKAQYA